MSVCWYVIMRMTVFVRCVCAWQNLCAASVYWYANNCMTVCIELITEDVIKDKKAEPMPAVMRSTLLTLCSTFPAKASLLRIPHSWLCPALFVLPRHDHLNSTCAARPKKGKRSQKLQTEHAGRHDTVTCGNLRKSRGACKEQYFGVVGRVGRSDPRPPAPLLRKLEERPKGAAIFFTIKWPNKLSCIAAGTRWHAFCKAGTFVCALALFNACNPSEPFKNVELEY